MQCFQKGGREAGTRAGLNILVWTATDTERHNNSMIIMLPVQVEAISHAPFLQVAVAAPTPSSHAPAHVASVLAGRLQPVNVTPLDAGGSA
jgi:hypothetical protein